MMVLETDEAHPDTVKEQGSFAEILHRHFEKAGSHHDPPLGVETDHIFVVTDKGGKIPKYENFEGVHCVLITRSCYDAYGDNIWILGLLALLRGLW